MLGVVSAARSTSFALASTALLVASSAGAAPPTASAAPAPPPTMTAKPAPPAPAPLPKPAAAPAAPAASPGAKPGAPSTPVAKPVPAAAAFTPGNGIVVLERGGKVLGVGTILNTDGRILTALSTLGDARPLDVRYADGSRATARVGHADRGRDLALVVPQSGWRKQGLKAATTPPGGSLRAFTGGPTGAMAGARVTLKGTGDFRGLDGKPLTGALELATPLDPASAGTPLVDDAGEVTALVTRACRPTSSPACQQVAVAQPVSVVREFLRVTPPAATLPVPHIGVRGIAEDTGSVRGVRVTIIAPGSPAASAGLRAGKDLASSDVLVAIDGIPVITPEALRTMVGERSVGDVLDLLVFGGGRFRHVTVVVAAAPPNAK
jgi:serine protease Do